MENSILRGFEWIFGDANLFEIPGQQGEALYPLKPWSPWPFGTLETFRSWSPIIFLAKLIFYIFSLKPLDFGNAKLLESPSQHGEALYPLKPWSPWPFGTLEIFRSWSLSSHGTRVDTLIRDVLHPPMKLLEDPLGPWKFKPLDLWEPRSLFTL